MMPEKAVFPSLDPHDSLPSRYVFDPEQIVDRVLGPGLTIVASEETWQRYIIQEQMAVSIATGEKFLDTFDVEKSAVLFIRHGRADRNAMKTRLMRNSGIPPLLNIKWEFPRIGQGAEKELHRILEASEEIKVVFLSDYFLAMGGFDDWYRKFISTPENIEKPKELLTIQYLGRQKAEEETRKLREVAAEHDVSIVLGHELTTQGKLRERDLLRYHDTEIHVRFVKKYGIYKLTVAPGSPYVSTNSWDLIYDEKTSLFLPERSLKPHEAGEETTERPLLDNEIAILDALKEGKVMSAAEVAEKTGISRSTVYQRLNALEAPKKGARVVSFESDGKTLYLINPNKEWGGR